MTKSTRNTGKPWSNQDVAQLKKLAKGNTPTRVMGLKLGRTEMLFTARRPSKISALNPPISRRTIGVPD